MGVGPGFGVSGSPAFLFLCRVPGATSRLTRCMETGDQATNSALSRDGRSRQIAGKANRFPCEDKQPMRMQ
jgi:hypothetical protein